MRFKVGQQWRTANGRLGRIDVILRTSMFFRFLDTGQRAIWLESDGTCSSRPFWNLTQFTGPDELKPDAESTSAADSRAATKE